jgi:mono/diheme cytochrome c family protein
MRRLAKLLLLSTTAIVAATAGAAEPIGFEQDLQPFFKANCLRCHDAKKHEGDLRLDLLGVDYTSPKIMGHWEEILNRINSGEMPPKSEPRPKPDDVARVAEWIADQLHESETRRQAGAERIAFRKLSREEYANTIHDLLGVQFDVKAPTGLPEDPDWKGFERIGSVLTLSPAHVEKYLAAAELVLDEALSLRPEPKRELIRWTPFDLRFKNLQKEFEARGTADQVRVELMPNNHVSDTWPVDIKASGEYLLRIKLSGLRAVAGRAPRLKVYLSNIDKTLLERDVDTPEDKPITIETRVHLAAGKYPVRLANSVPGPDPGARRSRHGPGGTAFTNMRNRAPWQLKLTDDDFNPIEPTLIIDSVEWDGPIIESWPTASHRRIFFGGEEAPKDSAYAREILTRFAERAWRRPVMPNEVERLLKPVETALKLGDSFESAVNQGLVAVLCSKSFLYLEEGRAEDRSGQLTDWELASRLSYFLWSSMPDQRLLDLARAAKLRKPATLLSEVRRMLADPKAAAFAQSFPRQWLQLRKVGMFVPDKGLYPEYDENLEQSMIAETVGFFGEVLQTNGSLREFLDSDWTMINERLAVHYGIEGIHGDQLRRVTLKPEHHRGGILTHAAVLSLTSDGTRHRPVHRGVWLLESIIGKPPPPPPANVPQLSTPAADQQKTTLRQKLELHRSDPNCTACHQKIDPLGMAFDNYDAIGRWRSVETIREGAGADPTLDPSGQLPDGRTFRDSHDLRQLLVADVDKFATAFTEKLATYALRRGVTFSDREALKHVVEQAQRNDYRLNSLIESLVTSPLFLKR